MANSVFIHWPFEWCCHKYRFFNFWPLSAIVDLQTDLNDVANQDVRESRRYTDTLETTRNDLWDFSILQVGHDYKAAGQEATLSKPCAERLSKTSGPLHDRHLTATTDAGKKFSFSGAAASFVPYRIRITSKFYISPCVERWQPVGKWQKENQRPVPKRRQKFGGIFSLHPFHWICFDLQMGVHKKLSVV